MIFTCGPTQCTPGFSRQVYVLYTYSQQLLYNILTAELTVLMEPPRYCNDDQMAYALYILTLFATDILE